MIKQKIKLKNDLQKIGNNLHDNLFICQIVTCDVKWVYFSKKNKQNFIAK